MTLEFRHFDTRLNRWINTDSGKNSKTILTEKLDNMLLEFFLPEKEFSFGHMDEYTTYKDLKNHPSNHVLLLSSKTRLLYGAPECLEVIDKLCPDRKDRGAYGSIFLGSCNNSICEKLSILVVDDLDGENGGFLEKSVAWKLVGDCYGQISPERYDQLTKTNEKEDKSYHVIQHRFGWRDTDGDDTKYRFGKGTLRPSNLDELQWKNNPPKVDIILPLSSFKGTDKDNPHGPTKPQIKPGLYSQNIWLGEKSQSHLGKTAISQLLPSFPEGIKDFVEELEVQAQKLAAAQEDPRTIAQLYCEKYEKRKAFTNIPNELKEPLTIDISQPTASEDLIKQLELFSLPGDTSDDLSDVIDKSDNDDLLMYKLIKSDIVGGHHQILETEKVRQELSRFVQNEWKDIAIGRTLTFERAMIIPSKELKNGEICVPWIPEGKEVLNFRSPFLNSNGLCVSINKYVEDFIGPDRQPLKGIIIVNDDDRNRILARIEAGSNETCPEETESERQGRDFDGDYIGVSEADKYPNLTIEAKLRNQSGNTYAPTVKLKKKSFYQDNTQPEFAEIAIHMSDGISVGIINNQVTALEALESEINILKSYGTNEQKSEYIERVANHYQELFAQELSENRPKAIRKEYKPYMQRFLEFASQTRTSETISQALAENRQMYRQMIEEGCFQNQIAVDLFKSATKPDMDIIRENSRYLYRDVNYIKDKKLKSTYLQQGITPKGYSPVELLISQTNKYFQESQLESRPIIQFNDLFKGVDFTPQQKYQAILAKHEFDQKLNYAVRQELRRDVDKGPSAVIKTQKAELEITNLTRYGHPGIWQGKRMNIQLEEIPEQYRSKTRPHQLVALAQIDNEMSNGKPAFRKLGTVSQQSVINLNLKSGMSATNAEVVELKPEITKSQCLLLFTQAYEVAQQFYSSIPKESKLSSAAAAWDISASRQDEVEKHTAVQKKTSSFVFSAFQDEIIGRLNTLQFTELKLRGMGKEGDSFIGRDWNPDDKYEIEVRASQYPPGHERHALRLVYVKDGNEYKEFGAVEPRSGVLPIGTKALAHIVPKEATNLTGVIERPGQESLMVTIRESSKFAYAGDSFNGEKITIGIGGNMPVPYEAAKIKIGDAVLGELDKDSMAQLRNIDYLKDGNILKLKLQSVGNSVIGKSPKGNLLKINNISHYDLKDQVFDDREFQVILNVPQNKIKDTVYINGEILGVLHYKDDREALANMGLLKKGQITEVSCTLQSRFSLTVVNIDPSTVEYPETWTKESKVFEVAQEATATSQEIMIAKSAQFLQKLKERQTIMFITPEDRTLGIIEMAVDSHKAGLVTNWLEQQNVVYAQTAEEEVRLETKKGLVVFNLVTSSIPEQIFQSMTKKFGEVIESPKEYRKKISSLPDRPQGISELIISPVMQKRVERARTIYQETLNQSRMSQQPSQSASQEKIVTFPQLKSNPLAQLKPLNEAVAQHMKKDLAMAEVATKFIGKSAAPANTFSSTRNYEQAWGDLANSGHYLATDIVMVSGSGSWRGVTESQIAQTFQEHYVPEMNKAIAAGSNFVVGNADGTDRLVQNYLQERGYQLEVLNGFMEATSPMKVALDEKRQDTIDNLNKWYETADRLGKPEEYKQRILQRTNEFKLGQPLSEHVQAAMDKDTRQLQDIRRLSQTVQKASQLLGDSLEDGSIKMEGEKYQVFVNPTKADLTIADKSGKILLDISSGNLLVDNVNADLIETFDKLDQKIEQHKQKMKSDLHL